MKSPLAQMLRADSDGLVRVNVGLGQNALGIDALKSRHPHGRNAVQPVGAGLFMACDEIDVVVPAAFAVRLEKRLVVHHGAVARLDDFAGLHEVARGEIREIGRDVDVPVG